MTNKHINNFCRSVRSAGANAPEMERERSNEIPMAKLIIRFGADVAVVICQHVHMHYHFVTTLNLFFSFSRLHEYEIIFELFGNESMHASSLAELVWAL